MAWNAKPSGGYSIDSDEAIANMQAIYDYLADTWTLEAVCGMVGNFVSESGLNPWRWQSDSVSLTSDSKGYGLAQFTPAYGYIYNYGVGVDGYAPNLSTSEVTSGADPSDGQAQLIVIDQDLAGKFINRSSWCTYYDISSAYPMSSYKQVTDLYLATVGWLFNYEAPADYSSSVASARYANASTVYEILSGYTPSPSPTPTPTTSTDFPSWMCCLKKMRDRMRGGYHVR